MCFFNLHLNANKTNYTQTQDHSYLSTDKNKKKTEAATHIWY